MRSELPLLNVDGEISEFQMNALCMRYGIPAAPKPNENALLKATSSVVRDDLKCFEPGKRVHRRDVERAKQDVQSK